MTVTVKCTVYIEKSHQHPRTLGPHDARARPMRG